MADVTIRGYLVLFPLRVILNRPEYDPAGMRLTHKGVFTADLPGGKALCVFTDDDAARRVLADSGLVPAGGEVVSLVRPIDAALLLESCRDVCQSVTFDMRSDGSCREPVPIDEAIAVFREASR